jgi:hypothetical protein
VVVVPGAAYVVFVYPVVAGAAYVVLEYPLAGAASRKWLAPIYETYKWLLGLEPFGWKLLG